MIGSNVLDPKRFLCPRHFVSKKNFWLDLFNLMWPVPTWFDMLQINLACPNWTWPVLIWLDLSLLVWRFLTWPVLTWTVSTWSILTGPVLTWSATIQKTSRHSPENLMTSTGQPPNFKHVGSYLPVEAKCGFFLPSSSFFFLPYKNKVNSYAVQLKLS